MSHYVDRRQAGRVLAEHLLEYAGRDDVVVLALPRGGVPVAYEVARALGAPLDVFVVRKIGMPFQPEVALGAIASGGVQVLNRALLDGTPLPRGAIEPIIAAERAELERREHAYRGPTGPLSVEGKVVILVDDGLATGASMRAAVAGLKLRSPREVIVAVPICDSEAVEMLRDEVEGVVCAAAPHPFQAVGRWYDDFTQLSDAEVRELLDAAQGTRQPAQFAVEGP
ncbi:MAG: phosphoribosyltransferase [Archangiaceae bacterium]|nr:phosphoribosyltransferase [Archangiaceae bacterium]